jgi:hypothetical protein
MQHRDRPIEVHTFSVRGRDRPFVDIGSYLQLWRPGPRQSFDALPPARTDERQRTIAITQDAPTAFMSRSMMERAQQHAVPCVRRATAYVVREMMYVRERSIQTTGEPANTVVAVVYRAP